MLTHDSVTSHWGRGGEPEAMKPRLTLKPYGASSWSLTLEPWRPDQEPGSSPNGGIEAYKIVPLRLTPIATEAYPGPGAGSPNRSMAARHGAGAAQPRAIELDPAAVEVSLKPWSLSGSHRLTRASHIQP
jgi:hypothetical protein